VRICSGSERVAMRIRQPSGAGFSTAEWIKINKLYQA
jgi:hypothetical protein